MEEWFSSAGESPMKKVTRDENQRTSFRGVGNQELKSGGQVLGAGGVDRGLFDVCGY